MANMSTSLKYLWIILHWMAHSYRMRHQHRLKWIEVFTDRCSLIVEIYVIGIGVEVGSSRLFANEVHIRLKPRIFINFGVDSISSYLKYLRRPTNILLPFIHNQGCCAQLKFPMCFRCFQLFPWQAMYSVSVNITHSTTTYIYTAEANSSLTGFKSLHNCNSTWKDYFIPSLEHPPIENVLNGNPNFSFSVNMYFLVLRWVSLKFSTHFSPHAVLKSRLNQAVTPKAYCAICTF